jgi:hypothetical protein
MKHTATLSARTRGAIGKFGWHNIEFYAPANRTAEQLAEYAIFEAGQQGLEVEHVHSTEQAKEQS